METTLQTHLTEHRTNNVTKTWVLMGVFLVGVTGLGLVLTNMTGSSTFLYGALGTSLVMNVVAYYNSAAIALKSAGAVPAERSEYMKLYTMVGDLSKKMQMPEPKLYIVEDDAPNAFATGRSPADAHIAVTTGLLARLTDKELEGILAHELSHVSNRDILVMSVAVVLVGALSVLANMSLRSSSLARSGNGQSGGVGLVMVAVTLLATIIAPIAAQLLQFAVSRRREYVADATGALVTNEPLHIATALEKIGSYAAPMKNASYTTAHLFISNPFGQAEMGRFLSGLFSTHPPIVDRVRILRGQD